MDTLLRTHDKIKIKENVKLVFGGVIILEIQNFIINKTQSWKCCKCKTENYNDKWKCSWCGHERCNNCKDLLG